MGMLAGNGHAKARHPCAARRANEVCDGTCTTCTIRVHRQGNLDTLSLNPLGKMVKELSDKTTMVLTSHGSIQ